MVREDFIGLSTDNKPTNVADGSTFYCADNSKAYVFFNDIWYEKTAEEPTPPTPVEDYGTITYLDSNDEEQVVTIQSMEEIDNMSYTNNDSWTVTINDIEITNDQIVKVNLGDSVKYVGAAFMNRCPNLIEFTATKLEYVGNGFLQGLQTGKHSVIKKLELPELVDIDGYFLRLCDIDCDITLPKVIFTRDHFISGANFINEHTITLPSVKTFGSYCFSSIINNFKIVLGNNVTTIGSYFLYSSDDYNNDITLPASITSVQYNFGGRMNSFISKVICECPATVINTNSANTYLSSNVNTGAFYTTGFQFAGTYKSEWRTALPNRTSSPYRKSSLASD